MSKILQFPGEKTDTTAQLQDETKKGVVKVEYISGEVELIEADIFAASSDIPGFLIFWNEDPEQQVVAMINSLSIKKMAVITNDELEGIKDDNCEGC